MTTQELANRYNELFQKRQVAEIYQQLYSADIVCTEPEHALAMGVPTVTKGIEAVLAKSSWPLPDSVNSSIVTKSTSPIPSLNNDSPEIMVSRCVGSLEFFIMADTATGSVGDTNAPNNRQ